LAIACVIAVAVFLSKRLAISSKQATKIVVCLCLPLSFASAADKLTEGTAIVFATPQQGRAILCRRDDYVSRQSPFDRQARLKTDRVITEEAYLEFVSQQVLPWNPAERGTVLDVLAEIGTTLDRLRIPLPERVVMIKTSGREEGGAAYTRANAIVLTESHLRRDRGELVRLLSHELFHVMSREDPAAREGLYATIGFRRCGEPLLPQALAAIKLTNPDAPFNDHCIDVAIDGVRRTVVPIILSDSLQYDMARGGEFFQYLRLRFLAVEADPTTGATRPILDNNQPLMVPVTQLVGFFEQVGRNTGYIIHPEEILADNFADLVTQKEDLSSPEVVVRMRDFFAQLRMLEAG
jgi:hypothetical protein